MTDVPLLPWPEGEAVPAELVDLYLPAGDVPTPPTGPGTELRAMLASVGIEPGPECPCRDMMRRMNRWGVEGCREHREEIVDHVRRNAGRVTWSKKLAAAAKATSTGLAFKLNPVDVPGSLVDEAIRRAEV